MRSPFDLARLSDRSRSLIHTLATREAAEIRYSLDFYPEQPSEARAEMDAWLAALEDLRDATK